MEGLASTLTKYEQDFAQLTVLDIDPAAGSQGNLATFIMQNNQLGALTIVASGAAKPSNATNVLSATVYISGTKTPVDVYRLALTP